MRRIPALAPETGAAWPGHWPRPSRLLAQPEPIETVALLPDHPPVVLHLARHAPAREAGRRARARLRRMVEARSPNWPPCGTTSRSRTTPASATGSSAPATARMPRPARSAGSCTGCSDERARAMPSCRSPRISASCAARRSCEELFVEAAALGIEALGDRRSQLARRHRPRPRGRQGDRRPPGRRLPARSRRRYRRSWSIRPIGRPIRGCAGCCRSARSAPARRSAISPGTISSPMAKG